MDKTLFTVIFLLVSYCTTGQIGGAEWVYISWNGSWNHSYNLDPVENKNGIVKLWMREEGSKKVIGKKTYYKVTTLTLEEYDCNKKIYKEHELIYYDSKMNVIKAIDFNDRSIINKWLNVVPESLGEKLLNAVCSAHSPIFR